MNPLFSSYHCALEVPPLTLSLGETMAPVNRALSWELTLPLHGLTLPLSPPGKGHGRSSGRYDASSLLSSRRSKPLPLLG